MSTNPSAQQYLPLSGGTIAGPVTITGQLTTQGGIAASGGPITQAGNLSTTGAATVATQSVDVNLVGGGLKVAEGANAKQGTAVLVAGTVTVADTAVTANSRIFLTSQADGGSPGFLRVSARVAGTSFTITSSNAADTSTVAYEIFEPG